MIILLTGHKRSGKDTTFNAIKKKYPDTARVAFADPIKTIMAKTLNAPRQDIELMKDNEKDSFLRTRNWSMRQALQNLGQVIKEEFGQDIWSKAGILKLKKLDKDIKVITDLRFPFEQDDVKEAFNDGEPVYTIKIKRDGTAGDSHESERFIDEIVADYTITNNGSIEDLEAQVNTILHNIMGGTGDVYNEFTEQH